MAKIPIDFANERIEELIFYFDIENEDGTGNKDELTKLNENGVTKLNEEILMVKILIDMMKERIKE